MRLSSNTPKFFQAVQDQTFDLPPIEDGNTLGTNQGIIYTSEVENIIWSYFPNQSYVTTVGSAPTYLYSKDGSIYTVSFDISYTVMLEPGSTNPGAYGSQLINDGDIFTITSSGKDYIRGFVSGIGEVTYVEDYSAYTYTYKIYATIMQGNPKKIAAGDTFSWNRKLFLDENNKNTSDISGIIASYDKQSGEIFLQWDENSNNVVGHKIFLRRSTDISNSYIINAPGTKINTNAVLIPYVNSTEGSISCVQIVDPDANLAFNREVIIQGSGTGSRWATDIDINGSLLISSYRIYDAAVGSNTISVLSPKVAPATLSRSGGYMLPFAGTYVGGLTSLSGTNHFYVGSVTGATANNKFFQIELYDAQTGLPVVITDTWKNSVLSKNIRTHDGVFRVSTGTGYTGSAGTAAFIKPIPDNIKWYWDPIYGAIGSTGQTWVCSVATGYVEQTGTTGTKTFTQWSIENYFNT